MARDAAAAGGGGGGGHGPSVGRGCGTSAFVALCSYIVLLLLLIFSGAASSFNVVKNLPGYDGDLPFYLETGYIGVGESNESQLFYYFVESQRSPSQDPLMLWLTGGPGCSVLSAFLYEGGPLGFTYVGYNGSIPSLHQNPYAWTQGLNMLFVDAPVGTGFSYSTTPENYYTDDYKSVNETYEFLQKFLLSHPQFIENMLYVGGDSYSGIPLPIIVQKIFDGSLNGDEPSMNLKGYVLGNPKTDDFIDDNSRIPFAHRVALVSDELFADAMQACDANYVDVDANNTECLEDITEIDALLLQINLMQILEPNCQTAYSRPVEANRGNRRILEDNYEGFLAAQPNPALWCREYNYVLAGVWANNEDVRAALGIREGTKGVWKRCNSSLAYTKSVSSSVPYHKNLSNTNLRALIYSGDHDMSVTYLGTHFWIFSLNLTLSDAWRAWYVNGQVAGYTEEFTHNQYTLYFATVKGAGHVAPEYKARECYEMLDRWLAYFYL
ncbi:serine carboxypeptidase-like 18 [Syzygium oleosum]|uniref:serine carboxypeptidase-like 18 n=1 Tax=Syzygium oleosum TaxID=219896 RepID=UPI0011D27379|nr:serine carboxypeptidase-like 18 [Syzygium oleosum]